MWPNIRDNPIMSCIGWLPSSLARAANRNTALGSFVLGVLACVLITFLPLAAMGGATGEPYRDLGEYVRHTIAAAPIAGAILLVVWSCIYALMLLPYLVGRSLWFKLAVRIVMLSPTALLIPGLLWSMFAALHSYAHPANGFYGPGGKPAWLDSMPITVLGSPLWLLAALVLVFANCVYAIGQLDEILDKSRRCGNCGYNLTGLTEPRCPECGHPFEPKGDTP